PAALRASRLRPSPPLPRNSPHRLRLPPTRRLRPHLLRRRAPVPALCPHSLRQRLPLPSRPLRLATASRRRPRRFPPHLLPSRPLRRTWTTTLPFRPGLQDPPRVRALPRGAGAEPA